VAIWIIAIVLGVGTILTFFLMVFASKNPQLDPTAIQSSKESEYQTQLQAKTTEHQTKVDAQNAELSKTYSAELDQYRSRVAKFDPAGIGDLKTEDLKAGDGAEVTTDNGADYAMYYIGWQPDGTIFDSSFTEGSEVLKSPLSGSGSYITGWTEGVKGMKIGGVRELTIPSDKAYGSTGSGTEGQAGYIAPDTPLKFAVLAIPQPEEIAYPKGTLDLCKKAYASSAAQYGMTPVQFCQYYIGITSEE
jgi:FKBP-type peptidyl-prolyl cis-trans isomerase